MNETPKRPHETGVKEMAGFWIFAHGL